MTIVFTMLFATTAFAALPKGTIVMGGKAFSLNYAAQQQNYNEILQAFQQAGFKLYYKNFNGNWEDSMGKNVSANSIPQVTYLDLGKDPVDYSAGDGDVVSSQRATVNCNLSMPGFLYVANITVSDDENAASYCIYDTNSQMLGDMTSIGEDCSLAPVVSGGSTLVVKIFDINGQELGQGQITAALGSGSFQYEISGGGGGGDFIVIGID